MNRLAVLFGRHRFLVACLVAAYTALSGYGITQVTFDNDPLRLLTTNKFDFERLVRDVVELEQMSLIVVKGDDLLTPERIDLIRTVVLRAAEVEGVAAVHSLLDARRRRRIGGYLLPLFPSPDAPPERFQRAVEQVDSHPFVVGHFLSEDRKTALVVVQFEPWVDGIQAVNGLLGRLDEMLDDTLGDSGLQAQITGMPAMGVEIVENMRRDIFLFGVLGAGLAALISVWMFRSIGAAILVSSGPFIGTWWTVGTLGLLGEPINILTNAVPILVLTIGLADSMHLVLHVRRVLGEGESSLEAAQSAFRDLGVPCALTSLSTAVAFGSLLVTSLTGIRTFGWCCALGSVLSFLAVMLVVPLLSSTPLSRSIAVPDRLKQARLRALTDRLFSVILGYPRIVVACAILLMLTMVLISSRLEPDYQMASQVPHSSEAYRALEHVDEAFGGAMFAYAVVRWPEDQGLASPELYETLQQVHQAVKDTRVLTNPLSILNLVQSLPGETEDLGERARELRYVPRESLVRLIDPDRRRAIVSIHMPDVGARTLRPAFAQLERRLAQAAERHPGYRIELSGSTVAVFRSIHLMIEDLWKSLATAAGAMFVMIWIGLRSLRYALVSTLPNVFPLLCTSSFIVLSGRYLEMSSVVVFSISLGIAVDDTIHFLFRFQREIAADGESTGAVRRTIKVVGRALLMTTVVLVAGNTIVMLSGFPAIQIFGGLAALTITSALVGDLLILPAAVTSLRWPQAR